MASDPGQRVDPNSPAYKEFVRLYDIARELQPSDTDRWNRELYATTHGPMGSFDPKSGAIRLSQENVLDHLNGPGSTGSPAHQAQALATVLHETSHARAEVDAPNEPNAHRAFASKSLDEGLTEHRTVLDLDAFADAAGYDQVELDQPAYGAAVEATGQLLDYAAGPDGNPDALARRAVDQPVVMRWDSIADEVVRNKLGDVVPPDPQHQQAARAELVNAMAHGNWAGLHEARETSMGEEVGRTSVERMDQAVDRIQQHYRDSPAQPYPATAPNPHAAANLDAPQNRLEASAPEAAERGQGEPGPVDLTKLPPPAAAARLEGPAAAPAQVQGNGQAAQPMSVQQGQVAPTGNAPAQAGQGTTGGQGSVAGQGTVAAGHGAQGRDVPPELRAAFAGQAPAAGAVQSVPKLGDGSRGSSGAQTGANRSVGPRTEPIGRDRD
ncbi:hypothetical protein OG394_39435 [Kribbella sp. NBC_01245]|uniref:hypothetical protein n=1 Tax=Kribbella sp. NBC_01245 TaxID=2903578 RepID=UPI002E2C3DB8|nr:hypothetical protein [Kribbella sp. NBC_01245]